MDMELLRANLLRTLVPIVVGALVTVLPGTLGSNEQLPVLVGFAVSWLYYAVKSVAWHVRPDGTPLLRLELGVADVAVAVSGTPGPASPAAGSAPPRPAS